MSSERMRHLRMLAVVVAGMLIAALVVAAPAGDEAAARGTVEEQPDLITVRGATYTMTIHKDGFRYGLSTADGDQALPPHSESGLRVRTDGAKDFTDAVSTRLVNASGTVAVLEVTLEDGATVRVFARPFRSYVRLSIANLPGESSDVDFRTGPAAPAYGLGDHGSVVDGDDKTPRGTTDLTGTVHDNLTNVGAQRFVSNFVIFPRQRVAEVLFFDGRKRVGLTETENRLGVAGADRVEGLYYFVGQDTEQIYRDYKNVRHGHGYEDAEPRPEMFGLGWEAWGALRWNTYQSSVVNSVQDFLDHGYPLRWAVVGSGFWPGPRGNPVEGTTESFGMWDDTCDYDPADGDYPSLPCPRYPDPGELKGFLADHDIALLLGGRTSFKALPEDGGAYNAHNDGDFIPEAQERGFFAEAEDGSPLVLPRTGYPAGPNYLLDGSDPEAVSWYVEQQQKWQVDGWKEDTMLHTPVYLDRSWNDVNLAMHDAGELTMVRNAAYSLPGDILRIDDVFYGHGEDLHSDPDRVPVNLLNLAASGASNLYPDIVCVCGDTNDPSKQQYFLRSAQFNAMTPVMSFGLAPWKMGRPDYAEAVKELALWHDALHPYIYDAALDSYQTGFPYSMTPLPIAYPDDTATYDLANDQTRQYEWMFGESLLAAPVFGADFDHAQTRDVYLPAGKWIDHNTGAVFTGPRTLDDYPIGPDGVPAFVGGKGVLVTDKAGDGLQAEVWPIRTGSTYDFTDGENDTQIVNANTGWDLDQLTVTDTTAERQVGFTVDERTGAIHFPITEGHDYRLDGGGTADHPYPLEVDPPAQPTGVDHAVEADATVTLSWEATQDVRSYVVTAETMESEQCRPPERCAESSAAQRVRRPSDSVRRTTSPVPTGFTRGTPPVPARAPTRT